MLDRLQQRVYTWEDGIWMAQVEIMRWSTMRTWIRSACKHYKVASPTLGSESERSKWSGYYPGTEKIKLARVHKNPMIVLHEVAHHICDTLIGPELPDHSSAWLGIYQHLLEHFKVFHRPFLKASMGAYKLPFRPLGPKHSMLRIRK